MSKSRAGCSWVMVLLAAVGLAAGGSCAAPDPGGAVGVGVGAPAATGEASLASPAGLRVGRGLNLPPAARAPAWRFHGAGGQLSAAGAQHRLQISDGVVRVQRIVAPAEQQRQVLLARARGTQLPVAPAALELETLSIARAGYQCLDRAVHAVVGDDGRARRSFAGCSERWTNSAQSGEVAFDFAQRPAGRGDLIVTLRAQIGAPADAMVVDADADGLRLAAPAGGERFRFGHATWVDAAGARTLVPARWDTGRIALVVPAALVESSPYPAVLDPTVGPDLGTDRPVLQPSSTGVEPQIASDGNNFLVVFSDLRNVHASRVDAAGEMLDFEWIDFGEDSTGTVQQVAPVVAFGGGRYLVVWWQFGGSTITIRGRLVDPDGSLVGSQSFPISAGEGVDPAVAWNGQSFVVAWTGLNPAPGVRLALVGADGAVVAGSERRASPTDHAFQPRVAAGSTTAAVAWLQEPDDFSRLQIGVTRIASDGTVLDPAGILLDADPAPQQQPVLASDGERFLVAWQRSGGDLRTIQGAILDGAGGITGVPFSISRSGSDASRPAVAFGAGEYLVAWQVQAEGNDAFMAGALVSPGGMVAGGADTRLGSVPVRASVDPTGLSWNGSHFLLAYDGIRQQASGFVIAGIDGSLIAPDLSLAADALAFSKEPNAQFTPHTVWDGLDYVVSWTDERNPFPLTDARAVRISSAGVVLDPDGIALSAPLPASGHDLASNGNRRSMAAWTTSTGRGVVRALAANGNLGPTRALAPGVLASNPLLASDGAGFLAAFARTNAAGTRTDLIGSMVAPNGNPGPLFTIRRGIDGLENLTAAGGDYLAQFVEGGVRQMVTVSGNGRVSAPAPAPATLFSTLVSASSNRNTLLAWVTATGEVQAQFFARGGLRGPVLSIADSSDSFSPTIAFDGRRYWIVWAADRDTELPMIRSVEVNGAIGATSVLVDEPCEAPELASNGNQQMLLACFRFTRDNFGPMRITTRLVDTTAGAGAAPVAAASSSPSPSPSPSPSSSSLGAAAAQ